MTNVRMSYFLKILISVLCVLSIIAVPVSFITMSELGDPDSLGLAGMLKYTWVMWLFIPIPVALLVISIITRNDNKYFSLCLVIAIASIFLLMIFGSFKFLFSDSISYDTDIVIAVEKSTGVDFPDNVQVSNLYRDNCTETNIKITDAEEMRTFERMMENSHLFIKSSTEDFFDLLPPDFQMLAHGGVYDYILFYNVTEQKYNMYPNDKNCEYIFILYDSYVPQMVIISNINLSD